MHPAARTARRPPPSSSRPGPARTPQGRHSVPWALPQLRPGQRRPTLPHPVPGPPATLSPTSSHPSLRPLDIEFMKRLSKVVNIVPVIAKADTLTLEERVHFKQRVGPTPPAPVPVSAGAGPLRGQRARHAGGSLDRRESGKGPSCRGDRWPRWGGVTAGGLRGRDPQGTWKPEVLPRGWGAVPSHPQDSPLPARVSAPGPSARVFPACLGGSVPPQRVSAEGEGSRAPPERGPAQGRGTLLTEHQC